MSAFDEFWTAYPRKTAKGDAKRAWEKAARTTPDLLAKCLDALAWQRTQEQWTRDGGQYIPYPATWIRGERWDDENPLIAEQQRQAQAAAKAVTDDAAYRAMRERVMAEQAQAWRARETEGR